MLNSSLAFGFLNNYTPTTWLRTFLSAFSKWTVAFFKGFSKSQKSFTVFGQIHWMSDRLWEFLTSISLLFGHQCAACQLDVLCRWKEALLISVKARNCCSIIPNLLADFYAGRTVPIHLKQQDLCRFNRMLSETEMLSLQTILNQIHEKHKIFKNLSLNVKLQNSNSTSFTMFDGKMLEPNIGIIMQKSRVKYIHYSFVCILLK